MNARSIHVFELRSPVAAEKLPEWNARLGWRTPLCARELETIASWARTRGGASIRLHGAAVDQLDEVLSAVPVITLDVDGTRVSRVPAVNQVRELTLRGLPARADEMLASFGAVRTLRLDARGKRVDLQTLSALAALRRCSISAAWLRGCAQVKSLRPLAALELVRTRVDEIDPLLRAPSTIALRLANVERITSLEALRGHANLRTLALESLLHLESLEPIATLPRLDTLAIDRLWQFNVVDAAFVTEMTQLRALSFDIGGARKNVEVTKHLDLPPAPPFDVGDYDFTTSYESGVQSLPAYLSSVTTVGAVGGLLSENGGV